MLKVPFLFGSLTGPCLRICNRLHKARLFLTLSFLLLANGLAALPVVAALDNGLVGHWPFDEGAGITVTDYSGNGNIGTLFNGSSWSAGKSGYSLSFDGSNDYVEVLHASSLDAASALTISAWINNESLVNDRADEYRIIASKGWAASSGGSWTLAWSVREGSLIFFVRQRSNTSYRYVVLPYKNSQASQWHLITAVFDQGSISLYQDDVLKAGPHDLGSNLMHTNTDSIRIGSLGISSMWLRNWDGLIDDVRVYNRPLTEAEIVSLYQAGQLPVTNVPFNFSLSNSGSLATIQGSSATTTITGALSSGTAQPVSFLLSGLPQGAAASLSKTTCTPTCSTLLTVGTSSSTPIGTYPLNVTGSAGNVRNSTTINLSVSQSFDFSLSTGSTATMSQSSSDYSVIAATLVSGASQPISFSASGFPAGVSHSFSSGSCSPACKTNLNMSASASAPTGSYPIKVTATGAGVTRSTSFTLTVTGTVAPSFDFTLNNTGNKSVDAGRAVTNTISAALTSGTSQPVSLSVSGLPSDTTAFFSSASCSPSCSPVLSINTTGSTPAGSFPVTITATGASVTRTTAFTLTVTVALTVATPTISPNGGSYTGSVSVALQNVTSGALIYYTTNGATPTQSSTLYTGAMTLSGSAVVKAKAFKSGYNPSGEASSSFTVTQSGTSTGNVYYVATTGSDANPGTETQSFRTINKSLRVMKPGDTLYIKEGTYAEEIDDIPSGLSWQQPVTIAAYPGHIVTLRPNAGGSTRVIRLKGPTKKYITIDGLILDAVNRSVGFETSGIDNASGPQHIRVKNVEIKNARNSGVFGVGSHHEFINCLVHHNGKRILDHGLYMTPTDSLIDQCTVYNNAGYGIHIYGGNAKNLVVRNSTVYNHPEAGIIIASGSEDVKVYNNIVRHNAGYGGILIDKALRAKVLNNTVYANSGAGIVVSSTDGRDTVIKNNILFQNKGPSLSDRGARTVQSHNLTADPQFENGSIGDFRLRAGSPAIDAGVTLSEVPTDSKGTPRPRGTEYDVGAFEF